MRINGWQRLWVVASALYLAAILMFAYSMFPGLERISHRVEFWDRLPKASIEKLLILEKMKPVTDPKLLTELNATGPKATVKWDNVKPESASMPNGHELLFHVEATKEDIKEISNQYVKILREEAFPIRMNFLFLTLLVWIVPCVAAYVLGWAFGWVYRGFNAP
jgi:hypothetical protein